MNADAPAESGPRRRRRRQDATGRRWPWTARLGWAALLLLMLLGAWAGARSARLAVALKLLDADVRVLEQRPELTADPQLLADLQSAAQDVEQQAGSQVEALELLARVHWLLASAATTPAAQIQQLRLARDRLQRALQQRSGWPYSWALLARIEFHLAPRGEPARIALTQALDLGMRGYSLQRQLLELRILAEDRVDPALLQRVRDSFIGGLKEHGTELADQAFGLGRIDWVCADPQARGLVEHWCIRMEGWIRSRQR